MFNDVYNNCLWNITDLWRLRCPDMAWLAALRSSPTTLSLSFCAIMTRTISDPKFLTIFSRCPSSRSVLASCSQTRWGAPSRASYLEVWLSAQSPTGSCRRAAFRRDMPLISRRTSFTRTMSPRRKLSGSRCRICSSSKHLRCRASPGTDLSASIHAMLSERRRNIGQKHTYTFLLILIARHKHNSI